MFNLESFNNFWIELVHVLTMTIIQKISKFHCDIPTRMKRNAVISLCEFSRVRNQMKIRNDFAR